MIGEKGRTEHTPELIVHKFRKAQWNFMAENFLFAEVMRHLENSYQMYRWWRSRCGAMRPSIRHDSKRQIRELRGAPQFLRMDNGPESIAETLRDWCKEQNIQANYCDPGSPWLTVASNHSTRDSETNY